MKKYESTKQNKKFKSIKENKIQNVKKCNAKNIKYGTLEIKFIEKTQTKIKWYQK